MNYSKNIVIIYLVFSSISVTFSKNFKGLQTTKYMLDPDSSFVDFLIIDFEFSIQFTASFGF